MSTAVRLAPRSRATQNILLLAVALLVLQALVSIRVDSPLRSSDSVSPAPLQAAAGGITDVPYGRLPLSFEANRGQADPDVKFLARGSGYSLMLTSAEAVLSLRGPSASIEDGKKAASPATLRMQLVWASRDAKISGEGRLPGKVNYLIGDDPSEWRAGIDTYARVRYRGVYPGVDVLYYGNQHQLEYDFILAPGTDPRLIRLAFRGAQGLQIDRNGDLVLRSDIGQVRQQRPFTYQIVDGIRREIPARYLITNEQQVGFEVGEYDRRLPLIIDPILSYSTFLGGDRSGDAQDIAVDADGNTYLTGSNGADVSVIKLDRTGSKLLYATYFGGEKFERGHALALGRNGEVYVGGMTDSGDFPVTPGAFRSSCGTPDTPWYCGNDAFVSKLAPDGSRLAYSTYLAGDRYDRVMDIAVDGDGYAYVLGDTTSTNFPTLNPIQSAYGGGSCITPGGLELCWDVFVSKLNTVGSALVYSTYLGGSGDERAGGIKVDSSRNAYISGSTNSDAFPISNALDGTIEGDCEVQYSYNSTAIRRCNDAFLGKLTVAGSGLVYSTFLGGTGDDSALDLALGADGSVYLTGFTDSQNFPTTPGVAQPSHGGGAGGICPQTGCDDAFVMKLNNAATSLTYSTYLGGYSHDWGSAVAVDRYGNAYLTGWTLGQGFPTTTDALDKNCGTDNSCNYEKGDAFVTKLDATASRRLYSSYLGGSGEDRGASIAADSSGGIYVGGITTSPDFPTTPYAYDRKCGSDGKCNQSGSYFATDPFVTKLGEAAAQPGPTPIGTPIRGGVALSTGTLENAQVDHVDFSVNGARIGTDSTAPYGVTWDSAGAADGPATLATLAVNSGGGKVLHASRAVVVDNSRPTAAPPTQSLISNSTLEATTIPIKLSWSATDATSGVAKYRVQQRKMVNGAWGSWSWVTQGTTVKTVTRQFAPGSYQIRVQAMDRAGNWSYWKAGVSFGLFGYQETSTASTGKVAYSGTWSTGSSTEFYGGAVRHTGVGGRASTFSFTGGRQVAWVAPKGANRGYAYVYLDGVKVATVNLYSSSALNRKVVFSKSLVYDPTKQHTLRVYVTGTKGAASTGARVDIDAFLIMR